MHLVRFIVNEVKNKDNRMYESFLEIAFEAELNTKEHPELLDIAYEQCNENLDTRASDIMELRTMIFERGEVKPHRTDDEFLLRFLRARYFIVPRAHKLLVRYYNFRKQYPDLQKGVDLFGLMKVNEFYEGSMLDRPDVGRLSVIRFGTWEPSELPAQDVLRAGLAISEIGMRQPKLQILGTTALIDFEGVSFKQITAMTPAIAHQVVCLIGIMVPVRVKACHIINYSWFLNSFIYIFKRFIPQSAWNKIFFHGNDLKSLHKHIDPECLPARYGGTCRNYAPLGLWFQKIKKYRDEQFDKEMRELGYVIKE